MSMAQRISELEATTETRESPRTASEEPFGTSQQTTLGRRAPVMVEKFLRPPVEEPRVIANCCANPLRKRGLATEATNKALLVGHGLQAKPLPLAGRPVTPWWTRLPSGSPLLAALGLRYVDLNVGLRVWDPALEPTHPGQLSYRAQQPPVSPLLPAKVELEDGVRHPLTLGELG